MHIDLAHAVVTGLIVFGTLTVLKGRSLLIQVGLIAVLVFALNLFWP